MIRLVDSVCKLLAALVFCLALSLPSAVLQAQTAGSSRVAAEALFDRALKLVNEGKYSEAIPFLEQSLALDAGVGTRLYLAECYERVGRIASAWAMFREAASTAAAEGQTDRARIGTDRAARLESQIPMFTLRVDPGNRMPGFAVSLNGVALPQTAWGIAMPVDPGNNQIEARAPGYETFSVNRMITPGEPPITVSVPVLSPAPDAPAIAANEGVAAPPSSPNLAPRAALQDTEPGNTWQKPVGIIAAGLGVVSLGLGTYFGLEAISRNNSAEKLCTAGPTCTNATGVRYSDQANSLAGASNAFVIGGLVLAGAGVVLWLTAPRVAVHGDAQSLRLRISGAF